MNQKEACVFHLAGVCNTEQVRGNRCAYGLAGLACDLASVSAALSWCAVCEVLYESNVRRCPKCRAGHTKRSRGTLVKRAFTSLVWTVCTERERERERERDTEGERERVRRIAGMLLPVTCKNISGLFCVCHGFLAFMFRFAWVNTSSLVNVLQRDPQASKSPQSQSLQAASFDEKTTPSELDGGLSV